MSFDDYLKLKDHAQQLRILIEKNAWRNHPYITKVNYAIKAEGSAKDGVRLAELMNPIPESL